MAIEILVVDAFTAAPFSGNPAAVCFLEAERTVTWMRSVAAEMNLSETAFVRAGTKPAGLRWFTPTVEVSLCGHATLAAAHALWETGRLKGDQETVFETRGGTLRAARAGDAIEIDLPARNPREAACPPALAACLHGRRPVATFEVRGGPGVDPDWLFELEDEQAVRSLRPDMAALRAAEAGLIVTARSESGQWDFVSRYFAPAFGVDEDPVTGAAHCTLIPWWSRRLGRAELTGYQASARGGVVRGRQQGDRVLLAGHAVTVLRGHLSGPAGA
jgi:predicted PhzF superfamily epimerase YddE/YHI9